ncbi:MAG TPA: TonB family protein [Steroidobacteraceae bacterium]|nr:TonB family protein [Steroidobacteraceae bacterium]
MSEVWEKWEGQVINGVWPLRRFLGGSDHSGVFLTESQAQNLPNAALKLVPAVPAGWEAQLARWSTAAALSHPHLIRLLGAGRCELGERPFLFVVMEHAEQTLSQILPHRALTPDEVREMLRPVLAALAYLHGRQLVQGQLKPTNILVVDDQPKLASDTIRPAGAGSDSSAEDIWSLGSTLVEALTQRPAAWTDDGELDAALLPVTIPPMFADLVRQCLDRNPTHRPTVADLQARLDPAPQVAVPLAPAPPTPVPQAPPAPPVPTPPTPVRQAPVPTAPLRAVPRRRWFAAAAAAVLLAVFVAVWAGLRGNHAAPETSGPAPAETVAASSAAPEPAAARPLASDSSSVLHEELPDVSRGALNTIRGRIKVVVRVTVDPSGNVVSAVLERHGSSEFFARLATEAARKWKFAAADGVEPRTRLLRFEFARRGVSGHASAPSGPRTSAR